MSLKHNPEVLQIQSMSDKVSTAADSTAIVLLIFLVFFIWYSNSFFLNQRKREIGIYTFMGIEKYKIAAIFTIENLSLGLTSIFFGLILGIIFSKLFMMVLAKIALLNMTIKFFISARGILETVVTFLIVFVITSLKGYFDITRSKLIDLFNAVKKEEQMPKTNYLRGSLSLIILGTGYYVSTMSTKIHFETAALVTIILVVWGTYWLFGSFSTIMSKYLTGKKNIFYKGTNIISISTLVFRIKKNYRTLAAIAILVATTITSFGTVSSFKYYIDQNYDLEVPYTFSYISGSTELNEKIKDTIDNSNHNLLLWQKAAFLYKNNLNTDKFYNNFVIVKSSDFKTITKNLKPKNYQDIIKKTNLKEGEAVYIPKPGVIMTLSDDNKNRKIKIENLNLKIKRHLNTPLFGNGVSRASLIVRDTDYELLKESFKEHKFNGIIVDKEPETEQLTKKILHELPANISLFSYFQIHRSSYDFYGIIYFLGAFMALVFIAATGSIIYFKILSDAFDDKNKYQMLKKIGMTRSEITKSVSRQVGISFAMPLIVGTIHSIFAIRALSKMMNYNLVFPLLISILIFSSIYWIYYFATTRKFLQIVYDNYN
jgi:putative ABC transport system permease protein